MSRETNQRIGCTVLAPAFAVPETNGHTVRDVRLIPCVSLKNFFNGYQIKQLSQPNHNIKVRTGHF
jgi:hypothetical protein